jgi:hypothetical protein
MIQTDVLITDVIALSDVIEQGFQKLMNPSDNIKILVRPE